MTQKILEGIKVLDLSQFLSGPRCSQLLALKGADVVKIEPPIGETMRVLCRLMRSERMMSTIHQNKRGITIDFKKPEGIDLLKKLAAECDVLVENFAPGLMNNLGLDYDTLKESNPGLVYVTISGYGRTGPLSGRTAFDIVAQASAGIMHAYRQPWRTPKVYFGDLVSGAYAALGAVEALFYRERTGRGQLVDISMQDVMYFQNFSCFSDNAIAPVKEEVEKLLGASLSNLLTDDDKPLPFWNSYEAKDGYIVIVALTDREWKHLMEAVGREDTLDDARYFNFLTRVQNAAAGLDIIAPWVKAHTVEEVAAILEKKKVPCAPVADFDMVNESEHLKERGMITEVEDSEFGTIAVPGDPIRHSAAPGGINSACPHLGEHTDEVLREWLGLPDDRIAALRSKKVI